MSPFPVTWPRDDIMKEVTFGFLIIITITSQYIFSDFILLQTLMIVAIITGYAGTGTVVDASTEVNLDFITNTTANGFVVA